MGCNHNSLLVSPLESSPGGACQAYVRRDEPWGAAVTETQPNDLFAYGLVRATLAWSSSLESEAQHSDFNTLIGAKQRHLCGDVSVRRKSPSASRRSSMPKTKTITRPCKSCQNPVAPNAPTCPKCGGKNPYPHGAAAQAGGCFTLIVLIAIGWYAIDKIDLGFDSSSPQSGQGKTGIAYPGDLTVLGEEGGLLVPVAVTLEDFIRYDQLSRAKDEIGTSRMKQSGLVWLAEGGTRGKILEMHRDGAYEIRFLSGPRQGDSGFVNVQFVDLADD